MIRSKRGEISVQPDSQKLTRREFSRRVAGILGSLSFGTAAAGCGDSKAPGKRLPPKQASQKTAHEKPVAAAKRFFEGTDSSFPMLEVSGKPYDIGHAVGSRFASEIRKGFEERGAWWKDLRDFAMAADRAVYDNFLAAARKHAPDAVEELRGWADGSGVSFRDLMILNLKAEYGAMKDATVSRPGPGQPGCSTVVINNQGSIIVAHNEDGHMAYADKMFMLKMHPEGKPSVLCASYPGILPGNAPWVNSRGIMMTTNFIYSKEVRNGVGRYFLDRLAMQASTVDEALTVCKNPERAYSFHHVIGSVTGGKAVSLEVTPSSHEQLEINGPFIHTNHLITKALADEAQDLEYVKSSSLTRYNVLTKWKEGLKSPAGVSADDIIGALSSHEGKPYSPCRHPEGDVEGFTLLTAMFDFKNSLLRIYKNQPCKKIFNDYRLPSKTA